MTPDQMEATLNGLLQKGNDQDKRLTLVEEVQKSQATGLNDLEEEVALLKAEVAALGTGTVVVPPASDFRSWLGLTFKGVNSVLAALWAGSRKALPYLTTSVVTLALYAGLAGTLSVPGCFQPGPVVPPGPPPVPTPVPVSKARLWTLFLYDKDNDSPAQAAVRDSKGLRDKIQAAGNFGVDVNGRQAPLARIYEKSQDEFRSLNLQTVLDQHQVKLPAVLFTEPDTGKARAIVPQPATDDGVLAELKKAGGM